jgi:hypothetical protein
MISRSSNLRRLSFVLLAADQNHYLTQLPAIQEKLVDILRTNVVSPRVHSEVSDMLPLPPQELTLGIPLSPGHYVSDQSSTPDQFLASDSGRAAACVRGDHGGRARRRVGIAAAGVGGMQVPRSASRHPVRGLPDVSSKTRHGGGVMLTIATNGCSSRTRQMLFTLLKGSLQKPSWTPWLRF